MFTMDNILGAKFGVNASTIEACFKKTVKTREYETEVVELRANVDISPNASGVERMLATTLLQAQLEYTAYSNLAFKGIVTEAEFKRRKEELEKSVDAVAQKYYDLTGQAPFEKFWPDYAKNSTDNN